jgi:hypothetical protein
MHDHENRRQDEPGSALPFQLSKDDPKGRAASSPEQVAGRSIGMPGEEIGQSPSTAGSSDLYSNRMNDPAHDGNL